MSSTEIVPTSTFVAADYTPSSDFMGWWLEDAPTPFICNEGGVYTTSYPYAGCSTPDEPFAMATGCTDDTWMQWEEYPDAECDSSAWCSALTIYPTDHAPLSDALTYFACFSTSFIESSLCYSLPQSYQSSTIASEPTNLVLDASPTTTAKEYVTVTSSPTPSSNSDSNKSDTSTTSISGGAIGGIVVGCVAGVAILVLLIFRKKIMACFARDKPPNADGGPAWSPVYSPPQTESTAPTDNSMWRASELSSEQNQIHEIGHSTSIVQQKPVHEIG